MSIRRRQSSRTEAPTLDPLTRISEHFILADFLGNHSVYTQGHPNAMRRDPESLTKIDNLTALAVHGLEPIMKDWGPLSVSYGYISPELSAKIVKYQDPAKPSHHRFDLGAAADICVHRYVQNEFVTLDELFLPPSVRSAPIGLAHGIDMRDIPYSRLITYSESPYICLAISATEVARNQPRKAFYENRYQGRKGDKPGYIQLSNQGARNRHFEQLQDQGLEFPWQGHGYPTYHGGGRRQYHHVRVSKYTMLSDWLMDLQSIANGAKNIPSMSDDAVQDAIAAAGTVYDFIVNLGFARCPIIAGFVSPSNPSFDPENDWRGDTIRFTIMPPASVSIAAFVQSLVQLPAGAWVCAEGKNSVEIQVEVANVLSSTDWV